jgi:hypothetical protein
VFVIANLNSDDAVKQIIGVIHRLDPAAAISLDTEALMVRVSSAVSAEEISRSLAEAGHSVALWMEEMDWQDVVM